MENQMKPFALGIAAALLVLVSSGSSMAVTFAYSTCYDCMNYLQQNNSVCTYNYVLGWNSCQTTGVHGQFYVYMASPGGSAPPQPMFVYSDGQVMRLPSTPSNLTPPPPPQLQSLPGGTGSPSVQTGSTTQQTDLIVRPLPATAGSGSARARCVTLSADGRISATELALWNRLECNRLY
jgi:hypothetical protein